MGVPEFRQEELKVVGSKPGFGGAPPTPIYDFPVTPREGYEAFFRHEPIWQVCDLGIETLLFTPWIIPDNVARAFVYDGTFVPGVTNTSGGKDMFGLDWTFVPEVGGSITAPGNPSYDDANDLVEAIKMPNPNDWDWDKCVADNAGYISQGKTKSVHFWWMTGWFERLISFMDFEGAIIALIDEDQKPAVHKFFDKLTDFYIQVYDIVMKKWPEIDIFYIHDDWGSQKDTFFNPAVTKEMIVPYMKRVTDHLHEHGIICELHSCGNNMKQVENMIEAGWDTWGPQEMNDTWKLYDEYGEDIILGVMPKKFDPATTSEAQQRELADEFVEKFCGNPKKIASLNFNGGPWVTDPFREEMYIKSRKAFQR